MRHKIAMLGMVVIVGGALASMMLPTSAQAGPLSYDGFITIPAGATTASVDVPLTSEAWDLDRIAVFSHASVTTAVTAAALDLGVSTPLESFALGAAAGDCKWPRRPELTYLQQHVVTGDVAFAKLNVSTNLGLYTVRDVRVTASTATNGSDQVLWFRIFSGN